MIRVRLSPYGNQQTTFATFTHTLFHISHTQATGVQGLLLMAGYEQVQGSEDCKPGMFEFTDALAALLFQIF